MAGDGSKKREHEGDDQADDAPPPFARLPIYGEHKRAVSAVALAPGRVTQNRAAPLCASASADGTAKIWDLNQTTASPPDDPVNPEGTPTPLAGTPPPPVLPLGRLLTAATTLIGHSRGINDVAWSCVGGYVATASDDKTLRLWDAATGDALVEFRGHSNFVFCVRFNPQSNLLVSGSFDETVKLWDVRTGDCVSTLPAHSDPVTAVDFNRDGTCIVSGSHDGLVRIWDTATGECLKTIYAHGNPPVSHVQYSPNGKYVLAGTLDSKLRLWHMASKEQTSGGGGKCTKTYSSEEHVNTKYCIASDFCVSNPKRQCIVTGSETGKIVLYDLNSRKVNQVLDGHTDAVLAVASHDKEELLVSGGMTQDKTVQFWHPKSEDNNQEHKRFKVDL